MATLLGCLRQILLKGSDFSTFANLQLAIGLQDSGTLCKYIDVSLLARCQVPDIMHPNYLAQQREANVHPRAGRRYSSLML